MKTLKIIPLVLAVLLYASTANALGIWAVLGIFAAGVAAVAPTIFNQVGDWYDWNISKNLNQEQKGIRICRGIGAVTNEITENRQRNRPDMDVGRGDMDMQIEIEEWRYLRCDLRNYQL
jgi:hypothetical protein